MSKAITTNARAIQALALETWSALTLAQRAALRRARSHVDVPACRLASDTHGRTVSALVEHGLADEWRWLTPLGALVREQGLEQTAREARRRFSRRRAANP